MTAGDTTTSDGRRADPNPPHGRRAEPRVLRRVFVANRGEIALRVIRTCRRLGIETVLGASDADLDALPARVADRTVRIGPPPAAASYLDADAVVRAAAASCADAVHPGYGFLAESSRLARACADAGLTFIGPSPAQLDAVGDKVRARDHAVAAGLPVVPGGLIDGTADGVSRARRLAADIGWPILVKAAGGGGGRGLRPVTGPADLEATVERSIAEASAAFGDSRVYLERFIPSGRHVEVQLLADGETVIHLGDRDCSVQRRYQKLVEEAPAPRLSEGLRVAMHRAAVALGQHLRYRGVGTVEFLVDADSGDFYFLEMNARIQVEHPVTEEITGLDLVAEQIAVAEGRPLPLRQSEVRTSGHAIECRINAEDPARAFRPSPGTVTSATFPVGPGIRVDTHVQAGSTVPPYYDSLVAKLVVRGGDREEAVASLAEALAACRIGGVATNLPLHRALCGDPRFARGGVDTSYLPAFLAGPLSPEHRRQGGGRG